MFAIFLVAIFCGITGFVAGYAIGVEKSYDEKMEDFD